MQVVSVGLTLPNLRPRRFVCWFAKKTFGQTWIAVGCLAWMTVVASASFSAAQSLVVRPAEVKLQGNFDRAQLLASTGDAAGNSDDRSSDLTTSAQYVSADPSIVTVTPQGGLLAIRDGQTKITVTVSGQTKEVPVTVAGVVDHPKVAFTEQIRPILNKSGCAMAACHAAQHGKGGFKLSVFGSEPDTDHTAMVRDVIQRRIDPIRPENSLVLLKPTMQTPHGGGRPLDKNSVDYQIFLAWIRGGAAGPTKEDPEVVRLHVTPARRVGAVGQTQQLRVEAEYSNGMRRDVTASARFDTMDDGVLAVTRDGLVTTIGKGQAPIMIRFEGQAEISMFVVPFADQFELKGWTSQNFVDDLAAAKFRELAIQPSPLCDDATFVRRAFLDAIGSLPTAEEARAFMASTDPDKRTKLVDRLLGLTGDPSQDIYNDWYAAYWSLRWSDLVRNSSRQLGQQGMWALHNWIRESFRTNKPFDLFVRELITAKGSIYSSGPANFYRVNGTPTDLTEAVSQTFLGIRLECAKCHHHPFEKYSQDDYYGLAAFFSRVGSKNSEEFGLFGREQVVVVRDTGEVSHPRTGKRMEPKALDGPAFDNPLDRRLPLAQWLTAKDNQYFARNVANRYVDFLLGRGLVEPVDDMRNTNPPTNPQLLDALASHLVDSNFNLKQLVRVIMTSRLYQLSSQPTAENVADHRFYSHFVVKRLTAEPLLDAIDRVCDVQTKYKSMPLGTRAIELPDAEYPDYFLNTFAKPRRAIVCECERSPDANLAQALHTLNGDTLATKVGDPKGRIAKLIASGVDHETIVNELYLSALSRPATPAEIDASIHFLDEAPTREECYQDILWALINSKQFLFVR
ncbi:MAG: DUF1553 domain-containing protein [Pirellulales bacterium]